MKLTDFGVWYYLDSLSDFENIWINTLASVRTISNSPDVVEFDNKKYFLHVVINGEWQLAGDQLGCD